MSLGPRIEERLAVVGISQSELARRVGVRQSTINSLIRGENRTSRSLVKIARELRTTAAYLSGDSDDPEGEVGQEISLGSEERDLLDNFGHLAPADRRALLQIARSMAGGGKPSDTVHPLEKVSPEDADLGTADYLKSIAANPVTLDGTESVLLGSATIDMPGPSATAASAIPREHGGGQRSGGDRTARSSRKIGHDDA